MNIFRKFGMTKRLSDDMILLIKEKLNENVPIQLISNMLNIHRNTIRNIKRNVIFIKSGPKPTYDARKLKTQIKKTITSYKKHKKRVTSNSLVTRVGNWGAKS